MYVTRLFRNQIFSQLLTTTETVLKLQRNISSAVSNDLKKTLQVTFNDDVDTLHEYPWVWLRDNCQCPQCYDHIAQQRTVTIGTLDPSTTAKDIQLNKVANTVTLTWPDEHVSTYSKEWLKTRQFLQLNEAKKGFNIQLQKKLWGTEMQDKIPKIEYNKLMSDDRVLYDWIVGLEVHGIQLITGAPKVKGIIKKLGQRVAYLTACHYGEVFEISVMPNSNATAVAYSTGSLGLHLDNASSEVQQGMQMLHCIRQTKSPGGANIFVDAFYVAKLLKEKQPEMYETLRTMLINCIDLGTDVLGDYSKSSVRPTLCEDRYGRLEMVTYGNHQRNSLMELTAEEAQKYYEALVTFEQLLNKHSITYKLQEGDIICEDNFRIMHGRTAFTTQEGSSNRHLEGSYICWGEMRSKRRVLESKLGLKSH